jgi:aspartyl-tRNA(Asn)/glutamyl-tRNA(Gln) amidotransferase subunit A
MGRLVTAADYLKAEQYCSLLMEAFRKVFADVDVVVTPTTPLRLEGWRVDGTGRRP